MFLTGVVIIVVVAVVVIIVVIVVVVAAVFVNVVVAVVAADVIAFAGGKLYPEFNYRSVYLSSPKLGIGEGKTPELILNYLRKALKEKIRPLLDC